MDQPKKKRRIRIIKSPPTSPYAYHIGSHDNKIKYLIGWPGYRTSNNRSGLGYIETRAEWAHMQGVMIYWMLCGKFKTSNPVYLLMIFITGIFLGSPILLLLAREGRYTFLHNLGFLLPPTIIGVLMVINVFLTLISCEKGESITGN